MMDHFFFLLDGVRVGVERRPDTANTFRGRNNGLLGEVLHLFTARVAQQLDLFGDLFWSQVARADLLFTTIHYKRCQSIHGHGVPWRFFSYSRSHEQQGGG